LETGALRAGGQLSAYADRFRASSTRYDSREIGVSELVWLYLAWS